MQKIGLILFVFSTWFAYAGVPILFGEFSNQTDAVRTKNIIKKILKKRYPSHHVFIKKSSTLYRVVSDTIDNDTIRKQIIRDVKKAFGMRSDADDTTSPPASKSFGGMVNIGLGYNNNIYSHTQIKTTAYNNFAIDNNTSIVRSLFSENSGIITHYHNWNDSPFAWKSYLAFYGKYYKNHPDLTLQQIAIQSGPVYAFGSSILSLPVYYKKIWFGGKAYQNTYGIWPKFTYQLSKATSLLFSVNLSKKDHSLVEKKNWNTRRIDATLGLATFTHSRATIYADTGLIAERRTQGGLANISYNGLFFSTKFMLPLWGKAYGDIGMRFDHRAYLDKHPNLASRSDTRVQFNAGIFQPITQSLGVKISYRHIDNRSTINAFTHKSDAVSLSISASF